MAVGRVLVDCEVQFSDQPFAPVDTSSCRICMSFECWTGVRSLCEKCGITTCAGSGHHLRTDRIETGASYFGKSLPVRPLSLPEFLRWCLLSRRLWFVVCFAKQNTPRTKQNKPSAKWQRSAERHVRQETGWLAGGPLLHVATIRLTTDTFLFISHTTNILLFQFCCNIFIGGRIIKEMPGLVARGSLCII